MDNIFNVGVSYFHTIKTEIPVIGDLYDLLTTNRYMDQVIAVRNAKDLMTKSNLKEKLPSYTPSGIFERSGSHFPLKMNNFICIDIDKKDNLQVEGFENLKEQLSEISYIAYCGLSCGGEGYFCIIPIADHFLFKSHFHSLNADFANIGITIDQICSDIGRKRFVSYDPDPYINYEPETYDGLISEPNKVCKIVVQSDSSVFDSARLQTEADSYINILVKRKLDITSPYLKWLRIGYAFANTFGETGRERFHKVSQFYYDYESKETDTLYSSCLKGSSPNPITIKTFLMYAREAGLDTENPWDREW